MKHNLKIIPPQISPETMKAMWEFFLKTSVPRILEERRLEKGAELNSMGNGSDVEGECIHEQPTD